MRPEDIKLSSLEIAASGTGNEFSDVDKVEVYLDPNRNGKVNGNEAELYIGEGVYSEDDGTLLLEVDYFLPASTSQIVLITYSFKED